MKRIITLLTVMAAGLLPYAVNAQVALTNPLGETDPRLLIARVINGALSVSGSIALLMFMYGGLLWMTSMGRSESIDKGKRILIWAVVGIIVIASAYVITNAVFQAVLTGDVGN